MTSETPAESKDESKPTKKPKWWLNLVCGVWVLWFLGGVDIFLLRDPTLLAVFLAACGLLQLPIGKRLKRPWNSRLETAWTLLVCMAVPVVLMFVLPPFWISRQTTHLTEPRLKDGYGIDYRAVIEKRIEPVCLPEENGFRTLLTKLGRPYLCSQISHFYGAEGDVHWNRICETLRLPNDIEPESFHTGLFMFSKNLDENERKSINRYPREEILPPWPGEALPGIHRWLEENTKTFELYEEAIRKPVFYAPLLQVGNSSVSLDITAVVTENIARDLQYRFRYRIAVGDFDGAWNDVLLQYRLAELQRKTIWGGLSLTRNRIMYANAGRAACSFLVHDNRTAGDIRHKREEIAVFQIPYSENELKSVLLGDRFTTLDALQRLSRGTWSLADYMHTTPPMKTGEFERFLQKLLMRLFRWEATMKDVNRLYDTIDEKGFERTPRTLFANAGKKFNFWKTLFRYGPLGTYPYMIRLLTMDFYSVEDAFRSARIHEVEMILTRFFFVLEQYCSENGDRYPESLSELQGLYVDKIPADPFSGKAFHYHRDTAEGVRPGFCLYSVGPNGLDDAGRTTRDRPHGDDLRRRMPFTENCVE